MPEVKLWFSPGACSLAPHVLLHEIGMPFEAVATPVSTGAQMTEAFARINPKKRVPVLSIDGRTVTEVPAIAAAISDLAAGRHLMGTTALQRKKVGEWMCWLAGTLHAQGFGALWRPQRFLDDPAAWAGIEARGRKTVFECYEQVENGLSSPHATGDEFTAVDPFLLVFYRWANGLGVEMASLFPKYARLARRLVQRDAVVAALKVEGIAHRPLKDEHR